MTIRLCSSSGSCGFVLRGAALALLVFSLAGLAGCEAVVGDSLSGTVHCSGAGLEDGLCPSGQECILGVCAVCTNPNGCGVVIIGDAGLDHAVVDAHEASVSEATVEASRPEDVVMTPEAAVPAGIGDECASDTACSSGLCIPAGDLVGVTVKSLNVCSLPCCADSDCGGTSVCYPTTGGNLCISADAAQSCGSTCGAPCCSDSNCGSGASVFCAIGATSAGTSVSACTTPVQGTKCQDDFSCDGQDGDTCYQDSDCDHGVCLQNNAHDSCDSQEGCSCQTNVGCCGPSDCAGAGGGAICEWVEATDSASNALVFRTCQAPTSTSDTQACCQDSDCATLGERWTCSPLAASVGVGNVPILVCQAPMSAN